MAYSTLTRRLYTVNWIIIGQLFFAVALLGFSFIQFIISDFIVGGAPAWSLSISGRSFFAYSTGALMMVSGILIIIKHRLAYITVIAIGILVFAFALVRHIPIVALNLKWGVEVVNAGKALVMFGGAFAMAATLPKRHNNALNKDLSTIASAVFIYLGRYCLSIFMIIGGIEHFIFLEFVAQLVPSWIPGKIFWASFTGIALICGGVGLLFKKTALLASILTGIMIFVWFLILHIPRAFLFMNDNEWIAVCESLAFSGIAFVLATTSKIKEHHV